MFVIGTGSLLDDCAAMLSLDPTNVDARKYRLRVFAAMEMWSEAQELLGEWVSADNEDALDCQFLPEDVTFFKEQHAMVTEKHDTKAREEVQQQRLNAIKLAKQEVSFRNAWDPFLRPLSSLCA